MEGIHVASQYFLANIDIAFFYLMRAIYHNISLAPWPLYRVAQSALNHSCTTAATPRAARDSEPLKYRDSSTPFQLNFRESRCFLGVSRYYIS